MYKVMLVDDEKPARELIKLLIDWNTTDFEIIDEAKDGKDALEKYVQHSPELIITDIQMPVMDGLELIGRIRKINKDQKIIILSCHENFSFAQKAMQLGITDYILKDFLSPEDLHGVLKKVSGELNSHTSDHMSFDQIAESDDFIKDDYKDIALRTVILDEGMDTQVGFYLKKYGINITAGSFVLMAIVIDGHKNIDINSQYNDMKRRTNKVLSRIRLILNGFYGGEVCYNDNGQFIALVCLDDLNSQLKFITDCHNIAEKIRRGVNRLENVTLTIGISKRFNNLNEIRSMYKLAYDVTKYRIFLGKGKTLFCDTVANNPQYMNTEIFTLRQNKIKIALDKSEAEEVATEIDNIYKQDIRGFMQYNYLKHVNSSLFEFIIEYCKIHRISYSQIFNCDYIPLDQVEHFETVDEISCWFSDIFTRMIKIKTSKENTNYNLRVKKAVEYIKGKFQEDISLSTIAEALGIHKVYLARIFKDETGKNVTDYILELRIEKSKQLILNTSHKIYEIAENVGFNNPQQFYSTFKKITGKSPMEYKEDIEG